MALFQTTVARHEPAGLRDPEAQAIDRVHEVDQRARMTPAARKHWRRLAKLLDKAGIIGEVDGLALRMLADSLATYQDASDKIAAHGLIAKTTNGNVIPSPFLAIRNRAWEQVVKLCACFGLTPADRNGMHFDFYNRGLRPAGTFDPRKDRFFNDSPLCQKPK